MEKGRYYIIEGVYKVIREARSSDIFLVDKKSYKQIEARGFDYMENDRVLVDMNHSNICDPEPNSRGNYRLYEAIVKYRHLLEIKTKMKVFLDE